MAIRHNLELSVTEPNNEVGNLKIRQGDEQTHTLVVQITENGIAKPFTGLQPFFCAKLGQTAGLGIVEQKVIGTMNPANGTLEYVMQPEDWQQIGRQTGYFSFRKMKNAHEWTEQFSTRDFAYNVIPSAIGEIREVKKDGSTYVWTIEDMLRLFKEYIATGKVEWENYKNDERTIWETYRLAEKTTWEKFVEDNREFLETADPGGKIILELLGARDGAATLGERLDEEKAEVTAQLAQTANLIDIKETPVFDKSGKLTEVRKSDGTSTVFSYDDYGTLNTITEIILGKKVVTTLNYENGNFVSVTRQVENNEPPITYPNTLIASVDNYLVNFSNKSLYLSRDGGKTYTESLAIPQIDIIKYIHIFEDGELLICDHQKAYYSYDWQELRESSVFDVNGNPFVPSTFDNFTLNKKNSNRQIISRQEILCWGNYSIAVPAPNINVWYTVDKGKTIKSCYKFNEQDSLSAYHIHNVNFNPNDNTFWLQTGDAPDMAHLVKGTYDIHSDEWTWNPVGSGLAFKWSTVEFYEERIYFAHDISGGGIKTCLYSEIADSSKHTQIMTTSNDTVGMYIGERGDMIVIQSVYGGEMPPRNFYYSEDRVNFHIIEGGVPQNYDYPDAMYYGYWAPNSKGKILTGVWSLSHESLENWQRIPSVFLDDFIRQVEFPNAFKKL